MNKVLGILVNLGDNLCLIIIIVFVFCIFRIGILKIGDFGFFDVVGLVMLFVFSIMVIFVCVNLGLIIFIFINWL